MPELYSYTFTFFIHAFGLDFFITFLQNLFLDDDVIYISFQAGQKEFLVSRCIERLYLAYK